VRTLPSPPGAPPTQRTGERADFRSQADQFTFSPNPLRRLLFAPPPNATAVQFAITNDPPEPCVPASLRSDQLEFIRKARLACPRKRVHPVGCQYYIPIWESGEWHTRTAECRQRSANPLPGKQMVGGLKRKRLAKCPAFLNVYVFWSGKRDSNPRPSALKEPLSGIRPKLSMPRGQWSTSQGP
jgi:hypothetical protein